MSNPRPDFGNKIRNLRKHQGMSQAELADRLGVSQKIISSYERNYRLPSTDKIPMLAETLGTTTGNLYSVKDDCSSAAPLRNPTRWRIVEMLEQLTVSELDQIMMAIEKVIRKRS